MRNVLISIIIRWLLPVQILLGGLILSQEIPRGFVLPVEFTQGFRSAHSRLYLASVRVEPGHGFAGNRLFVGGTAAAMFTNPRLDIVVGPRVALRIAHLDFDVAGRLMNLYISGELLWGTHRRRLWNGGIVAEVSPFLFTARVHREYQARQFWFDLGIGINLDTLLKRGEDISFDD
ncbi:MAG: hypothetical protein D6681_08015 [Calditrichaeota bacterium]|nr:MAG: hypothetical protein D6681_08015 [Calditrichota bacterium]